MQQVDNNVSVWSSPNYDNLLQVSARAARTTCTHMQAVPPIGIFWGMFATIAYIMQTYGEYKRVHTGRYSRSNVDVHANVQNRSTRLKTIADFEFAICPYACCTR
jgi:hypothetical protein